jgi:hypothetical protein
VFFEYYVDAVNEDCRGSFENCYVSDRLHKTAVAELAPNFPMDLSLVGILIEALSLANMTRRGLLTSTAPMSVLG